MDGERTIADVVAGALDSETMQQVIEKALEDGVQNCVADTFRYGSEAWKALRDRIDELLVPAIERIRLDNARLDLLLNELLSESVVGERARLLENFGKLATLPVEGTVKASEIFAAWCKDVAGAYDCHGREVVDGEYLELECSCELEVRERNPWSDRRCATLHLFVEDCDPEQEGRFNRDIDVYRWPTIPKDEDLWFVHAPAKPGFAGLAQMTNLDVMLARMTLYDMRIRMNIPAYGETEFVQPDAHPEYELV